MEAFSGKRVLVVGDVMLDAYLWGNVNRISPEAPVPVVQVNKEEKRLGGAANVALNLRQLNAKPVMCAVTGNDIAADEFNQLLKNDNIDGSLLVRCDDRPTTVKTRILGNKSHLLRVDRENGQKISSASKQEVLKNIEQGLPGVEALIFQDYDKGLLDEELIGKIINLARKHNVDIVVDPKKLNFLSYKNVSLFKPNLKELTEGLKIDHPGRPDKAFLENAGQLLKEQLNPETAIVTLSEHGVWAMDKDGQNYHIPARYRDIVDVSGAGDTVLAVTCLARLSGMNLPENAWLANLAGGMVCEKVGVVPVNWNDLLQEAEKELNRESEQTANSIKL